jgi:hypothetical protein
MAFPTPDLCGVIFRENRWIGDFGIRVHQTTFIRLGVTLDELENGPPGGGGGAHGLVKIVFLINDVDKSDPFTFTGFNLPAGWPSDAWTWNVIDPPASDLLTVTANTGKYGNLYLLQTPSEEIGFSFGSPFSVNSMGIHLPRHLLELTPRLQALTS